MTPLISIVVPIFNRAGTVGRAVEGCLLQTYERIEIVLVDDCSTDDLQSALKRFDGDERIRLVQHAHNQGVSAARNTGVQNASGDLIAFLDSDDAWYPRKLERQWSELAKFGDEQLFFCGALTEVVADEAPTKIIPARCKPDDVRFGDYMFVRKVRQKLPLVADDRAGRADGYFVHLNSVLLPRKLALETPFRTTLNQYEDLAFVIDLEERGASLILIEEPLAIQYDDQRPGRLGKQDDIDRGHRFLREMGDALSADARLAFETSHLAHLYARARPFHVARLTAQAFFSGLIGPRTVGGILFRSFLGQGIHRIFRDGLSKLRFGSALPITRQ